MPRVRSDVLDRQAEPPAGLPPVLRQQPVSAAQATATRIRWFACAVAERAAGRRMTHRERQTYRAYLMCASAVERRSA